MLLGLGLFVDLDWGRFPLWVLALAAGAVGFAALGLAIGALTREVRAASLLALMVALPLAFLALVPSGSVAPALYDVTSAISALFPFKPALDALAPPARRQRRPGRSDPAPPRRPRRSAFGAIARLGLRRFA